jgi:putative ABC transport system permease protein
MWHDRCEWGFRMIESFFRDLRIGARALRRTPLFTAGAALTLALGIGASAAMFSLIDAVLLRPLPFPQSDRIVMLWERPPERNSTAALDPREQHRNPTSPLNFVDWRDRTHSFAAMAAMSRFPMGLSAYGSPREVESLQVSAAFFHVLGVSPLLGRVFDPAEDVPNGPRVVVLSYRLWQEQFGGDRSIVGRNVLLHDEPYQVIGVMPEGFNLPADHTEIWVPVRITDRASANEGRYLHVLAKLKPEVSIAQAQTDLLAAEHDIARERPANRDWGATVMTLYEQTTGDVSTALLLLFGAVMIVLLIASGNVANLLLMRGTHRLRQIALRAALGASRARIVAHLLAESSLLSLSGGALGIAFAFLGLRAMVASLPALAIPRSEALHIDVRVLAFSLALSILTTLLFGLAPALSFSRTAPDAALKENSTRATAGGGRMRGLLVVSEVALSLVLLIGAGLLARSFLNEIGVNHGLRTDHILTLRMVFAPARYANDQRRARYVEEMLARVRSVPGVLSASSVHILPMLGTVSASGFRRSDRPEPPAGYRPVADYLIVSPQYFSVMGIPLLRGRDFSEHDTMSPEPSIIVNQAFADKFFPSDNPLGKRLELNWNIRHGVIVGVAASTRQTDLKVAPEPTIFLSQAQSPMYFGALVVRTALAPPAATKGVVDAIRAVDPDQAISHIESMEQVVSDSVARPRLESLLLAIFAVLALVLAAVGLYGVLAYAVALRTREIGVRMALGASPLQLVRGFVRDGIGLILPGLAAGLAASLALTRLLGSLLYGVTPIDPLIYAAVSLLLLIVGIFASWLPARRAAAVDPAASLRAE